MPNKQSIEPTVHQKSSPQMASPNRRDRLFDKQLQSIRQYMAILQEQPQRAQIIQCEWERNFYKAELKVAISINFSLVKHLEDKQAEIYGLLREISQLKKQKTNQPVLVSPQRASKDENSQLEANRGAVTPKRHVRRAFEAERQILGAKHSQEKEYYLKKIESKEQLLQSSKQENYYLREKLIEMGQKLMNLQLENNRLCQQLEELQQMNHKVQFSTQEPHHAYAKVLNFSPIETREQDNRVCIEDVSFHQTPEKNQQMPHQNVNCLQIERNIASKDRQQQIRGCQTDSGLQERYYKQLQKNYVQLNQDLTNKIKEIENYRIILAQLRLHEEQKVVYCQEVSEVKRPVDQSLQQQKTLNQIVQINHKNCEDCQRLSFLNKSLCSQLEQVKRELSISLAQFERALSLERKHRQEWELFEQDAANRVVI